MKAELKYKDKTVIIDLPGEIAINDVERERLAEISSENLDNVSIAFPSHVELEEQLEKWIEANGFELENDLSELNEILDGWYLQKGFDLFGFDLKRTIVEGKYLTTKQKKAGVDFSYEFVEV